LPRRRIDQRLWTPAVAGVAVERGWRFKCSIDASANLPSLASGFPRPPLGGGGRPSGNDGLGIFAAPTVTAAFNSAARRAGEGRKMPGPSFRAVGKQGSVAIMFSSDTESRVFN